MTPEEIELHKIGMKYKLIYSMFGLGVGALCILAGTFLGISGVVGHTSWAASLLGFSTNINDAAPGVIVFVVGIFFVLITKFKVRHIVQNPTVTPGVAPVPPAPNTTAPKAADVPDPVSDRTDNAAARRDSPPMSSNSSGPPPYSYPPSGGGSEIYYTTFPKND